MKEIIKLGRWSSEEIDNLLDQASKLDSPGKRIALLSAEFIDTPYRESTLISGINSPEALVINLEHLDCFTFLDYIEALRLSFSFAEFRENLKKVRYRSGEVSFERRNHFFSDWIEFNGDLVEDVTAQVSNNSVFTDKVLNRKEDGSVYIPGIHFKERKILYIPTANIEDAVIYNLRTGDYIGIYSDREGLDVSHVGIFIKDRSVLIFRHASSTEHRKVIDEDFRNYIKDKPGIVVLRANELRHIK